MNADPYLRELAERGYRDEDAPRFLALWERLEAAYFDRMIAITAPLETWRDKFHAAANETVRLVEAYPAEARFFAVDALAAGELGRRRHGDLAARIADRVDSVRAELEDPASVSEATAAWIVAIFFDRIYRRCVSEEGPDLPSQLPELMFLAISAYFGTGAGLEELIAPP